MLSFNTLFCHYRVFFVVIIIFVIVIFTFKSRCNFFSLLSSPFYFSSHLKCFSQVTVTSPFLLLLLFRFFFPLHLGVIFCLYLFFALPIIVNAFPGTTLCLCCHSTCYFCHHLYILFSFILLHLGVIFCLYFLFALPIIVNTFPGTTLCLCCHSTFYFCHHLYILFSFILLHLGVIFCLYFLFALPIIVNAFPGHMSMLSFNLLFLLHYFCCNYYFLMFLSFLLLHLGIIFCLHFLFCFSSLYLPTFCLYLPTFCLYHPTFCLHHLMVYLRCSLHHYCLLHQSQ